LEGLRDAIEATLLGGAAAGARPGDTLVAAAGAIGRASALRGVISAAEAAAAVAAAEAAEARRRRPAASAQTSPPEKPRYRGGLSTAAYVGGTWRQLYELPPRRGSEETVLVQPPGGAEGPMTPSKAAFLGLQRAAAATALPDPFGFCRRRGSETADAAPPPPPPPQQQQQQAPPPPVEQPPLSGLSVSIRALSAPADARACAAAMSALDAVMSSGRRDSEAAPVLHAPAAMRAPPLTLSPSKAGVNAGAVAAARALLAALEEGASEAPPAYAPPLRAFVPPPSPLPSQVAQQQQQQPAPPLPPPPLPPPPSAEEGVDSVLRALSAIRSATGETASFLNSLAVGMGRRLRRDEEDAAAAAEDALEGSSDAGALAPASAAAGGSDPATLVDGLQASLGVSGGYAEPPPAAPLAGGSAAMPEQQPPPPPPPAPEEAAPAEPAGWEGGAGGVFPMVVSD
jgi:hypothetical protein